MSQFEKDQAFYEEHRDRASSYCKFLQTRLVDLRKQVKTLERAFVASATIKRRCEEEIIPIRTIPIGMTKKKSEEQQKQLADRAKNDPQFREMVRLLLRKEGYNV